MPRSLALVVVAAMSCSDGGGGARPPTAPAPPDPVGPRPAPRPAAPPPVGRASFQVVGRTLEVALTPDKGVFMVSDPVYVELAFLQTDEPLEIAVSWMNRNDLGRPENYEVTVTGAGGTRPVRPVGPGMGGKSWWVQLQKEPYRAKLFLPSWVERLDPGPYTIRVATKVGARANDKADWTDVAVAAEVAVEVVADDSAELAAIIDRLGTTSLEIKTNYDNAEAALVQLAAIRDPRVIPHLVKATELREYSQMFKAVSALGTWNDDRALAAIIRVGATTADDLPAEGYTKDELRVHSASQLRHSAAVALSSSPHPRALDALLAMKADAYEGVRLTILHRVADLPDPTGTALVQAFLTDPDPTIVGEAQRYLRERKTGP